MVQHRIAVITFYYVRYLQCKAHLCNDTAPFFCTMCSMLFISKESARRMMPSASASSKFPLSVSSAMVVVMTLVYPAIFPPTISIAPTSAITLPKAAMMPDMIPYLASLITVTVTCKGVAPSVNEACLITGLTLTMAEWQRAVTMGKARMACAIIIAEGE